MPKRGMVYKFASFDLDSLGHQISDTKQITLDTVAEDGLSIYGKTQVIHVMTFLDSIYIPKTYTYVKPDGDTLYYTKEPNGDIIYRNFPTLHRDRYIRFESNGDISEYMFYKTDFYEKWVWVTFPIKSKVPFNIILIDTTLPYEGIMTHVKIALTVSYEEEKKLLIGGKPISAIKIKHTGYRSLTSTSGEVTNHSTYFDYFAPSIGYFIRQEFGKLKDADTSDYGFEKVIIDYR